MFVFSTDFDSHLQDLEIVFQRLRQHKFSFSVCFSFVVFFAFYRPHEDVPLAKVNFRVIMLMLLQCSYAYSLLLQDYLGIAQINTLHFVFLYDCCVLPQLLVYRTQYIAIPFSKSTPKGVFLIGTKRGALESRRRLVWTAGCCSKQSPSLSIALPFSNVREF